MSVYAILKQSCPVYRDFWSKSGLCDIECYSENYFDQKLGILTKITKKFYNFENFENFQKMRQSLAKDCIRAIEKYEGRPCTFTVHFSLDCLISTDHPLPHRFIFSVLDHSLSFDSFALFARLNSLYWLDIFE